MEYTTTPSWGSLMTDPSKLLNEHYYWVRYKGSQDPWVPAQLSVHPQLGPRWWQLLGGGKDSIQPFADYECGDEMKPNQARDLYEAMQANYSLSQAYLRLRTLIGEKAFKTPHAPNGEAIWRTTEAALQELVDEVKALEAENKLLERQLQQYLDAIRSACGILYSKIPDPQP